MEVGVRLEELDANTKLCTALPELAWGCRVGEAPACVVPQEPTDCCHGPEPPASFQKTRLCFCLFSYVRPCSVFDPLFLRGSEI